MPWEDFDCESYLLHALCAVRQATAAARGIKAAATKEIAWPNPTFPANC